MPPGPYFDCKKYDCDCHTVPAEKWEEDFHHLFEILTDSGKNLVNGRDDFEYWSFHDTIKSFIRHELDSFGRAEYHRGYEDANKKKSINERA